MGRTTTEDLAREARQRRDDFHFDYGNARQFEVNVLQECLVAIHRFISHLAGEMPADAALDALVGEVFGPGFPRGGWLGKLDEEYGDLFTCLPMGEVFHDLNAYAYDGITLTSSASPEERESHLQDLLERAVRFHALIPLKAWDIDEGDLGRTVRVARGRWALDHDRPIEPQALAILGGVTERRIRNMMSRTEALFQPMDGRIPADQALEWLRGRPTQFRQSLWMAQDPDEMPDFEPGHIEKVVFVPVGADGSVFHPGLSRDGHFLLGAGAEDLKVDSFEEALAELQSMVTPVWRRPTGHDRWTRVQGVRWERMTMELLEATAAEG